MDDRPNFIRHWRDLEKPDTSHYPGSEELLSIGAPIGQLLGLTRFGFHHERLPPGRRTSYPHAESAKDANNQGQTTNIFPHQTIVVFPRLLPDCWTNTPQPEQIGLT